MSDLEAAINARLESFTADQVAEERRFAGLDCIDRVLDSGIDGAIAGPPLAERLAVDFQFDRGGRHLIRSAAHAKGFQRDPIGHLGQFF